MSTRLSLRSTRTKLDLLRQVPAFARCTDRELAEAARHVDDWSVLAGTVLTREGMIGREAFIVVDGRATVTIGGEAVAEIGPGEFIGEMALVDHGPRSATVVADTPMRLLLVSPSGFDELTALRTVGRELTKELADRLRRADARRTT